MVTSHKISTTNVGCISNHPLKIAEASSLASDFPCWILVYWWKFCLQHWFGKAVLKKELFQCSNIYMLL